ncbi:phosphatidylglycerol/phosphatidylinositol transfer protein precursor [Sporormia fimetaria CBS 119925]|uniref:Phosphatidylglycerol/phosphatidylinositol transfer protein n=1 Tax=Sporormia fimetaria CBS 119925 TaxID=1340428 RepID=A0A6A6VHC8_9PLEO|nr:phosphatidylglycerol/phosphatidylinositol transfer protein precursor [Sporormia fimetaria CBS 119925]
MRISALLLSAVCAISVSASWVPGQVAISEDFKVPGDNPLHFCGNPKDDLLEIEKVDLSPNPPQPGHTLSIKASGDFKEKIEEGAKVHIQVKYGLITLINQESDLCDALSNVDLKCPLDKGEMTLTKDVDLPKQIPPGKYTVLADVFTKDGDKITCLTATVVFSR